MRTNVKLTRRETEVAELLSWGASKQEVANQLFIALDTVENHVRHIYEKIDVHSIGSLSAWWFCTHYHIPFDYSPIKCRIIALSLLAIVISTECITHKSFIRTFRTRASISNKMRSRSRRKNENELDLTGYYFT